MVRALPVSDITNKARPGDLGTGTPDATKVLAGNGTWVAKGLDKPANPAAPAVPVIGTDGTVTTTPVADLGGTPSPEAIVDALTGVPVDFAEGSTFGGFSPARIVVSADGTSAAVRVALGEPPVMGSFPLMGGPWVADGGGGDDPDWAQRKTHEWAAPFNSGSLTTLVDSVGDLDLAVTSAGGPYEQNSISAGNYFVRGFSSVAAANANPGGLTLDGGVGRTAIVMDLEQVATYGPDGGTPFVAGLLIVGTSGNLLYFALEVQTGHTPRLLAYRDGAADILYGDVDLPVTTVNIPTTTTNGIGQRFLLTFAFKGNTATAVYLNDDPTPILTGIDAAGIVASTFLGFDSTGLFHAGGGWTARALSVYEAIRDDELVQLRADLSPGA